MGFMGSTGARADAWAAFVELKHMLLCKPQARHELPGTPTTGTSLGEQERSRLTGDLSGVVPTKEAGISRASLTGHCWGGSIQIPNFTTWDHKGAPTALRRYEVGGCSHPYV